LHILSRGHRMKGCYWVISAEAFREAMQRARDGEDPQLLYVEYWANSEHRDDAPGEERE